MKYDGRFYQMEKVKPEARRPEGSSAVTYYVPPGCEGCPDNFKQRDGKLNCASWFPHYEQRQKEKWLPCNTGRRVKNFPDEPMTTPTKNT